MIVAPSLFAADASNFAKAARQAEEAGAKTLHLDIMDGCFVPNFSFGPNVVAALRPHTKLYFDVHLMIEEPAAKLMSFIRAGADCITVHWEATDHIAQIARACEENKVNFGLALRPETPVAAIEPWVGRMDLLLIMSIHPGVDGQNFMPQTLPRIAEAAYLRQSKKARYKIGIDGGINAETGRQCAQNGADLLVAGKYLYGAADMKRQFDSLCPKG